MKLLIDKMSKKNILNEISFSMNDGDKIALIGPNGSGKSTLLNIIMNITEPTKGLVIKEKVDLASVFQNNILDDELTVLQNIQFRIKDVKRIEEIRNKLSALNIKESLRYSELSGGQKRIVNYFRAIMEHPNLLVLDELSAGIDFNIRKIIWDDINKYFSNNKCGVIFTTHLLDELKNANKIMFLSNGNVKYFGNLDKFMEELPKFKLIIYDAKKIKYFSTSYDAIKYIENNNLVSETFEIKKVTYEDLFENMEDKV